jgi:probable H4MPT-linked C1 transfer pathway protein
MTGELTDLFAGRAEGVRRLVEAMARAFPDAELGIYAGEAGFLTPAEAVARPRLVASANWHAAARFAAARFGTALFVDVGSTTTDIVPVTGDDERLAAEELVYSGATRTPVMALADSVPFAGRHQRLMAELFATAADVHRLTGALPDDADQLPTADGRGKTAEGSARRLARMLGCDLEDADMAAWRALARHLAERQRRLLQDAMERVLSRSVFADDAPLVGAGIGRFLLPELARRLHRPYADFADLVAGDPEVREWAARCAPAAAVAALAAGE